MTYDEADHPRMCGEHCSWIASQLQANGSSPHVRGARSRCLKKEFLNRIIPACAGSTP